MKKIDQTVYISNKNYDLFSKINTFVKKKEF
jgi:hypothetical protein